MRIRPQIVACLIATALTGVTLATADTTVPRTAAPELEAAPQPACPPHVFAFRSVNALLDSHVIANLLSDVPMKKSDLPLTVVTGEITRCGSQTCTVPLVVRVSGAEGPVTLAFAVSNSKGELSDVHHAECGSGACGVSLVLERGQNTLSIGVIDVLSQTTAYTTLHVNANRAMAGTSGKTEWF